MVNEADYSSMQLELFDKCDYPPGGYILDSIFSKTSQERFQAMKEWTFAQSLNPLQNVKFQYLEVDDGRTQDWLEADDVMLGGESSMLNILEAPKETSSFPKEGEGYGLSQILEKSTDVPKKYFLSAKACRGIINRSERRNKTLPPILKKALEMQAGITHDEVSILGGQMYDITHADDVVRETDKSPTLNARMGTGGNQVPILMGDIPSEKNGIITYDVKTTVKVRKHEVDTDAIRTLLRDALNRSGLSKKDIAERLDVPQSQVDHYFRQDKYFSLPNADVWIPLKNLLGITTDEFDKQIMEFDEIECNFDTANRIYDAQGISPTITSVNADRMVLQSEKLMSTTGVQNGKAYAIGNGQVHQLYLQDNCGALNCMQEQDDVWSSSRAGFWLDFTKNVTNSLVAGGYKGQNIVAVTEKEQDEHTD